MHRTGRGVIGNKPASGTEIIQELGEEHQKTGKWIVYTSGDSVFQIAAHEETVPLEELYEACRDRARDPHRQARGRARDRAAVRRRAGQLRRARRTATTTRSSRAGRTTCRCCATPASKVHGVGKIGDIFAGCDIDESHPTKSNIEGIQQTEQLLQELDDGLRLRQPRRDRHALGPPQRPGELPPLPAGLRPAPARPARRAAPGRSADPHVRPRLRSDDAVDRPLARARDAASRTSPGRNAAGQIHEGEFADVGATVNAWLEGQGAVARHPRAADPHAVRLDNPLLVRWEYASEERLAERNAHLPRARRRAESPEDVAVRRRRARCRRRACSTSAAGRGELTERIAARARRGRPRDRQSARMVELTRARGVDAQVGDVAGAPVRRRGVRLRRSPRWMLYHVPDVDRGDRRAARACCGPADGSSRRRYGEDNLPELWDLIGDVSRRAALASAGRTARSCSGGTSRRSSGATSTRHARLPGCRRRSARSSPRRSTARTSPPSLPRVRRAAPRDTRATSSSSRRRPMIRAGRAHPAQARRRRARRRASSASSSSVRAGDVPDYQLAAFCMAVFFRGTDDAPRRSR